jgi:hypothetical protein
MGIRKIHEDSPVFFSDSMFARPYMISHRSFSQGIDLRHFVYRNNELKFTVIVLFKILLSRLSSEFDLDAIIISHNLCFWCNIITKGNRFCATLKSIHRFCGHNADFGFLKDKTGFVYCNAWVGYND